MLHFIPGALSFLVTLLLVIDWALHRRSLIWYAGPLLVGAVALFQLGERYLLDLFIGGGVGGLLGWVCFKLPLEWMTLRWQRRAWLRRLGPRSKDARGLIGARGERLNTLAAKGLIIAPTWVVTPAALLDHIVHSPLEEDFATLTGLGENPDDRTLTKLAQRGREIIVGEPLPRGLHHAVARAWNEMTEEAGGDPLALLTAWPTGEQAPIERATLWPHRWRLASNLDEMCESLLELWADNLSFHGLRQRRERGESLVDHRLAVALQPLSSVAWSGLATSADPRGGGGWMVECWPGRDLFALGIPCHRRTAQKQGGSPSGARVPTALVVAQVSRAAQMASHALGTPAVITWRATKGEEITILDAVPLARQWSHDTLPPRFSPEGSEWGVRKMEFGGEVITSLPAGPNESLCRGRVLHTKRLPTTWQPSCAALSGWVVEEASVLGHIADACRESGQGMIITHGMAPVQTGPSWAFRDEGGAPRIAHN